MPLLNRDVLLFARLLGWSLGIAIVVLSVVPPTLRPDTSLPHNVEHLAIFWATGIAFGLGYSGRYRFLLPLLIAFAAGVEILQLVVPGRHARLSDFIVDALAACVGALMALPAPRAN
jgi:VanZ family protein